MKNLLAIIVLSAAAFGQGVATSIPIVINQNGVPVANVLVAVCNSNPGIGNCPSLATLYTDQTLGHACTGSGALLNNLTNPSVSTGCSNPGFTDGLGNVVAFSSAGLLWCQYSSPSIGTTSIPCPFGPSTVIQAASGESVAHAIARLPAGGGCITFGIGTYPSGSPTINIPNVCLLGSGRPNYNSTTNPTALTGGTIIQGPITGTTGSDHLYVAHLGIDVGPNWVNNVNGGVPTDGLSVFNVGQVIGANQVQAPVFEDLACLGFTPSAAFHCFVQENVNNSVIHDVTTVFNTHGTVVKGTNVVIDKVVGKGHSSDCIIFTTNNYAVGGNVNISNFHCGFETTLGDGHGIVILANNGGNIQKVQITNGDTSGVAQAGIRLIGTDGSDALSQVTISNVNLDGQTTSGYCITNEGFLSDIQVSNITCANYTTGGIGNINLGTQNDFNYSNVFLFNITGNGIDTVGRTNVTGSKFINVSGNAIQTENSGITAECNNFFSGNGGNIQVVGSGTFRFCGWQTLEDTLGDVSFPVAVGPGKSAIASFPACSANLEGNHLIATTCNAACTVGGTCTTGGTTHCEMYCSSAPAWVETGR